MGKGFAVVAAEVKQLASQTTKATEEIADQVSNIQGATQSTVGAIHTITQTIGEINSVTTNIASAVEQQEASTREIANSIHMASEGTNLAVDNVNSVTKSIDDTAVAAGTVQSASDTLTKVAEQLADQVEHFLADVAKDVEERRVNIRDRMHEIVIIKADGHRVNSTMQNVSPNGCLIEKVSGLSAGDEIRVELADGHAVEAVVSEASDDQLNLQFKDKLADVTWLAVA
jgi:uncharacterized phage infection (PIP) family protein YhgE